MDLENVDLRKLRPTAPEHDLLNQYALVRKMLVQYLIDIYGEEYSDTLNPEAADEYGRLGWYGYGYCDGAMSPEVYYACVDALGWSYINAEHVDPYIETYCSLYNEWMEKLEIVPNAAWLAAELAQAACENAMCIDVGDENGGQQYDEETMKKNNISAEYWKPAGPYNKVYYARGLSSITWEGAYKQFEEWCISENLPWRPYSNPEIVSEDLECSITSLIWSKYINGGAFGDPDKVINAHLNAEDPEQFLIVVQSCAGITDAAEEEAEGDTRERFELFLPIIEGILRSGDVSYHVKGENQFGDGRRRGTLHRHSSHVSSIAPITVHSGAVPNWPSLDINRGIYAISKGLIHNDKFILKPGCKPQGQCAGGVSRLVAYMCGIDSPACNSYNATAAYNFMDGKLLRAGTFRPNGPQVPGMAGDWVCVAELKGKGRLPAGYTPQPGDIVSTDTGKRNGTGFHLEIFLGANTIGRSGWWSDYDQAGCLSYNNDAQHKRYWRRSGGVFQGMLGGFADSVKGIFKH